MIPWALADVRSDKLIALKEAFYRQSAPNLTNLFATVAVEQMGGFVTEGCVALIFLLKGGLMLPSFLCSEGPSQTGLLRNHGLKPKFMLKRSSTLQNFQQFIVTREVFESSCFHSQVFQRIRNGT